MPNVKCYVLGCKNKLSHLFPKKPEKRALWLEAIGRAGDEPKQYYGLCSSHFTKDDFATIGWETGIQLVRKRLKRNAIPTIGIPDKSPKRRSVRGSELRNIVENVQSTQENLQDNNTEEFILPDSLPSVVIKSEVDCDSSISNIVDSHAISGPEANLDSKMLSPSELCEIVMTSEGSAGKVVGSAKESQLSKQVQCDKPLVHDAKTQTIGRVPKYTIFDYQGRPDVVQYLTGLDSFSKFMFVFKSLKTEYNEVEYRNSLVLNVSLEDQLFLTLWKLRRNTPDFELALHFAVSQATISNIVASFVTFMAKQWKQLNTWPKKSLVDLYLPENLKKPYQTAKVISEKTEIPTSKKSENSESDIQQDTLKVFNNKSAVKVLVGANISSSDSQSSVAQGGTTVSHKIVDKCDILKKCKVGDLIMVDRSFNVEDLFGSKGVVLSIPSSLKGKDPNLERLIGLAKSFKILAQQLNPYYVGIASEIFYVCVMLCHFRVNTVIAKS